MCNLAVREPETHVVFLMASIVVVMITSSSVIVESILIRILEQRKGRGLEGLTEPRSSCSGRVVVEEGMAGWLVTLEHDERRICF